MVFSSLFRKQTPFKSKSETSKKGFKPRCKKHWKKTEVNKKEISQKMPSQGCFLLWPSRREKPRWLVRFNPTTKGVELRLLRYDWFRLQTVSGEVERESERYWQNHDWGLYTREEAVRWLRVILVAAISGGGWCWWIWWFWRGRETPLSSMTKDGLLIDRVFWCVCYLVYQADVFNYY